MQLPQRRIRTDVGSVAPVDEFVEFRAKNGNRNLFLVLAGMVHGLGGESGSCRWPNGWEWPALIHSLMLIVVLVQDDAAGT